MNKIFIIGGGPAGLTAGIYAANAGYSVILSEKEFCGGNVAIAPLIENYPGFESISGYELAEKMKAHAKKCGVEIVTREVTKCNLSGDKKLIELSDGTSHECDAVIICSGTEKRKLDSQDASKFEGKGISYCAVCDGNFFKGKDVAVFGGGDTAFKDVLYLSNICNKIYLIHRRKEFRGLDTMLSKIQKLNNVEIILESTIDKVGGSNLLEYAIVKNRINGEERKLDISGIFCAMGSTGKTELFEGYLEMDDNGYIQAGEDCKTSIPGVYVAGDVRRKKLKQILTAACDGANAAVAAIQYIKTKD